MGDFPKQAYDRWATQTPEEASHYNEYDEGTCSICGDVLEDTFGNNPSPICEEGRCCNSCNINIVIPERMKRIAGQKTL